MNVPLARAGAPASMWWVLGLAVVTSAIPIFIPDPQGEAGLWRFFPLVLTAGLLALGVMLPRRLAYALEPDALVVSHMTGQTRLPLNGMTVWRTAGHLGLKMGGTGLPGYYTGNYLFHTDGLKNVLAASSATRGGVIVQANAKAYFLTPADPEAFVAELAQRGARIREN
ncbi:hypothetical protein D3875_08305 [Deinococcus cavernae]|uniref:Bacterial Pleckstrin homology domain-containing protein n=1 Tax=Deinococcus cavernae TaxID=2320857 RepID=A0A418V651_9DEIO|nr:PH domain-containing protein [Deinococcus cavernae]RJF71574.1 hypothetical protein D3875_08305 [Deinococcus cavernae]